MIWVILYALNIHLFDINLHFKIVPRKIPKCWNDQQQKQEEEEEKN